MQGFFQVASCSIPPDTELAEAGDTTHIEYIIISRRSRDRAGLRYQRRGVDDDAHVANFVETETITRVDVCDPNQLLIDALIIAFLVQSARTSPISSATFRLEDLVSLFVSNAPGRLLYLVPLFWTQSGAGLKPPPQLSPEATHEQNLRALTRHFKRMLPTYGPHVGISKSNSIC